MVGKHGLSLLSFYLPEFLCRKPFPHLPLFQVKITLPRGVWECQELWRHPVLSGDLKELGFQGWSLPTEVLGHLNMVLWVF